MTRAVKLHDQDKNKQIIVVEMTSIETGAKTTTKGSTFNSIVAMHEDRFKDFKLIDVVCPSTSKPKKVKVEPLGDFQKYKEELIAEEREEKTSVLIDLMNKVCKRK